MEEVEFELFFMFIFIHFWLCWVLAASWAFSSCREQGLLSSCRPQAAHCTGFACCRAQAAGRSRVRSCGVWALGRRFSSCGTQALLPPGVWDLPGPGIEPVSPALASKFLTADPPGKPQNLNLTS